MGKKKRKKKKKKKNVVDLPPPVDPLTQLSTEEIEFYKEMFEMADIDKKGTIDESRLL